jgi:hypothetical protein
MWSQVYDPFNNATASTLAAALPVVTLLVLIASNKIKAHVAAIVALIVANVVAIFIFTMPANMSLPATVLGAVTGFFPIGWIVLNVIFFYRLTVEKGVFETLQNTIGGVTNDRRLQLLLIAFSFGAFFEGASGFGTPVAVTGAILIGLGFSPLAASDVFAGLPLRRAADKQRQVAHVWSSISGIVSRAKLQGAMRTRSSSAVSVAPSALLRAVRSASTSASSAGRRNMVS